MHLVSLRFITANIKRLVSFYERVTELTATWYTDDFAELRTAVGTLAIGSTRTLQLFGAGLPYNATAGMAIVEFRVQDVDARYEALKPVIPQLIQAPTTMPWGNRSLLFRDPDGNLVNLFTPVTARATP